MHPVGFEPTISAGERQNTYALDRAATGAANSAITYLLTYLLHGAEPLLKSQLVLQLVKKFPAFLEPEGSSPYPQAPATCPYPELTLQSHSP